MKTDDFVQIYIFLCLISINSPLLAGGLVLKSPQKRSLQSIYFLGVCVLKMWPLKKFSTLCLQFKFACEQFRERILEKNAPGEDRTHGLQITRLTRCLLRYQGLVKKGRKKKIQFVLFTNEIKTCIMKTYLILRDQEYLFRFLLQH